MDGIKYFIYQISRGRDIPYIDIDIRKMIWEYATREVVLFCSINPDGSVKLFIQ
jgi:hypothetical protein